MESKPVRVLVGDDHPILLEGLNLLLKREGMEVVALAKDGDEAMTGILNHQPDLAILDIVMPKKGGIALAGEVKKKRLKTRVILLTAVMEKEILDAAMHSGADGYVLKENTSEELIHAIFHVMNGKTYVSPLIGSALLAEKLDKAKPSHAAMLELLTAAEKKVLVLLAQNRTSNQIGEQLYISPKTVHRHRMNICQKLGLKGSNALLTFIIENKHLLQA